MRGAELLEVVREVGLHCVVGEFLEFERVEPRGRQVRVLLEGGVDRARDRGVQRTHARQGPGDRLEAEVAVVQDVHELGNEGGQSGFERYGGGPRALGAG